MRETLYRTVIRILDCHRTWLEIVSTDTVSTHMIVKRGRLTGMSCRMLVLRTFRNKCPYIEGQTRQIAEYELDRAVRTLRRADTEFRRRTKSGDVTIEDVERIITTATHGIVKPDLSELSLFSLYTSYDK